MSSMFYTLDFCFYLKETSWSFLFAFVVSVYNVSGHLYCKYLKYEMLLLHRLSLHHGILSHIVSCMYAFPFVSVHYFVVGCHYIWTQQHILGR